MKRLLLSIFFSLAFMTAFAQNDYVLTTKGDTIYGRIGSTGSKLIRVWRGNEGQETVTKIPSAEVAEAFRSSPGTYWVYKVLHEGGKPLFIQRLQKGTITLYEHVNYHYSQYGSSTTVYWYAEKAGNALVEIKTNSLFGSRDERKTAFTNLISDQPQIVDRFNKEDKFNFKFIKQLIEDYNALSSMANK